MLKLEMRTGSYMTLEHLRAMIGQKVRLSQLDKVFDTHIILTNADRTDDNDVEGILSFVGKELTAESDKLFVDGARICSIFREKEYFDGDISYDD